MQPHLAHRPGQSARRPADRRAFTLIELLIVLSIIAVLASFLTVGVMNSIRTARIASVKSDISVLEKGISDFKLKYGIEVPSSIELYEDAADWSGTGTTTRRSRALIRRIWPDFDFTYSNADTAGEHDINGDGDTDDTIQLNGTECLVFFLGGMTLTYDSTGADIETNRDDDLAGTAATPARWTAIGFSANPQFPFSREGTSRIGPFVEFDGTRFVVANDDMPGYVDPIPGQFVPYSYANASHSIRGSGYQTGDLATGTSSSLTAVYGTTATEAYNPRSFQIVSPGFDFTFGTGGVYDGEAVTDQTRADERDNISNFSAGEFGG